MNKIEITPEDIKYAEGVLLKSGQSFADDRNERIAFIQHLETCDLLAVPGSGKTTALMAKLICLERKLPFADGSGILVLAHTNAAVDEIKAKLASICPRLFEYPNFVGTVQSFVNQFLAGPFAESRGFKLTRFDDDLYRVLVQKSFRSIATKKEYDKPQNQLYPRFWEKSILDSLNYEASTLTKEILKKIVREHCKPPKKDKVGGSSNPEIDQKKSIETLCNNLNQNLKGDEKVAESDHFYKAFDSHVYKYVAEIAISYSKEKIVHTGGEVPFWGDIKKSKRGQGAQVAIEEVLKSGCISFPFAYELGWDCLHFFPATKSLIQSRFKYVFVDEAQDLTKIQLDILDACFFGNASKTIFQRIGDKNQAIYSSAGSLREGCDWITRAEAQKEQYTDLAITGSNRLTAETARKVDPLAISRSPQDYRVIGKKQLEIPITPMLMVYAKQNKGDLLDRFRQIIQILQQKGAIPLGPEDPFKAIAWNTRWKKGNKKGLIRLEDICEIPTFVKKQREYHADLISCLRACDLSKKSVAGVVTIILEAMCEALNLSGKRVEQTLQGKTIKRYFRPSDLEVQMKAIGNPSDAYEKYRRVLFILTFHIVRGELDDALELFKKFIFFQGRGLFPWLNATENADSRGFVDSVNAPQASKIIAAKSKDELPLVIDSVHNAKGETHCATLYIETSYKGKYETGHLDFSTFNPTESIVEENKKPKKKVEKKVYAKQAQKMLYVGFSRPTHFLCFAVLEENVKDELAKWHQAGWNIDTHLCEGTYDFPDHCDSEVGSDSLHALTYPDDQTAIGLNL